MTKTTSSKTSDNDEMSAPTPANDGRGAPLPPNESARLASLYQYKILDTLPEKAFDDIALLAANICGTPFALVSLVDARRQWAKAFVGQVVQEIGRESSFCAHAILAPDTIMVVPDTLCDDRLRDNEFVTGEPGLRFYAGAPLVMGDGMVLGTLCVLDVTPRELTDRQLLALDVLRRSVVNELELRRTALEAKEQQDALRQANADELDRARKSARAAEERYRRAFEGAPVMNVITEAHAGEAIVVDCNRLFLATLGYSLEEVRGQPLTKFYSPESAQRLKIGYQLALQGALHTEERELVTRDGTIITTILQTVPEFDVDGRVIGTLASFTDISLRRDAEDALRVSSERFAQMADNIQEVFWMFDNCKGRLIYVSPGYDKIWGRTAASLLDDNSQYITAIHPDDRHIMFAALESQARGERTVMEYRIVTPDGAVRWIHDRSFPVFDGDGQVIRTTGIAADVTERKLAELALRASEEKYRGLMESLESVISMVDADGRFLYVNDVAASELGMTPAAMIGRYMYDLFPKPVADRQLASVRSVLRNDQSIISEAQSMVNGRPRWYRTAIHPLHDESGRAAFALVNATDIHDLKTAQEQLLELNRTLEERVEQRTAEVRDLYDNAPCGYHSLDPDGNYILVNFTELAMLGYARDELIGTAFAALLTVASRQRFADFWARVTAGETITDVELDLVCRDGHALAVTLSSHAVYDASGQITSVRSTMIDVTERQQAAAQLRFQSNLLAMVGQAIVASDIPGTITYWNSAAEVMFGWTAAEALGKTVAELIVPPEASAQAGEVFSAALAGKTWRGEIQTQHRSGATFWVELATAPVRDDAGQPVGIIGIGLDITSRKLAEENLRRANLDLENALRVKDEFLANMSHELRTPLHGILATTEVLLEQIRGPINERQRKSLHAVEDAGNHLLDLINDLLDIAKLDAGKLSMRMEAVVADDVCLESLAVVREIASNKNISIAYSNNDFAAYVRADPVRLKQMLVNLLSNAVKFTDEGGRVQLSVAVKPAEQSIQFAVQDTGIGIAAADLTRLFQPFVQVDSSLARQYEGTGLGLALVKRLAVQHGGAVYAESAGIPGQGSRFVLTLPYDPALGNDAHASPTEPARVAAAPADVAPGTRILLAEDTEVTIAAVSGYLEHLGCKVTVARTGIEALERSLSVQPDAILMDIQLPYLDGLEVTRRLRSNPSFARVPIIALTALALPGDRERCLRAGADDYLSKPISMKALSELLARLLQR